jgi:hypothetical protein
MASGDAHDALISYAHSDGGAAGELNGWLCAQGLSTFFDRRELRPGLSWVPAHEDAIGRSNAFAILVGKHGISNTQRTGNAKISGRATRHSTGTVQRLRIDVAAFVFSA